MAKKKKYEKIDKIVTYDNNGNITRQTLTGNTGGYTRETTPVLAAVTQTVKPTIGQTAGYLGKAAKTGFVGGATSIPTSNLQEIEGGLKKGKKINNAGDAVKQAINSLSTISNITNPLSLQNIINSANNMSKTTKKALKDKNKSNLSKALSIGTAAVSNATDMANPTRQLAESVFPFVGAVDKNSDKKVRNLINTINQPAQKMQQDLAEESQKHGKVTNMVASGVQAATNMIPSLAATAITKNPNIGMAVMANNVKGQATEEALRQGKSLEEAREIGNVRAAAEVATEMLSGGLANIYGKGATDDVAKSIIDRYISNPTANYLATKASGIIGENVEESLSNVLNKAIDKGTVDPNAKITWDDITEPWGPTTISTLLLNGATGDYSRASFNQNAAQLQAKIDGMNNAERGALTEITIKRKNGIPLDENDMATLNYLNNKDVVGNIVDSQRNQNFEDNLQLQPQQTQENRFTYEPSDNVKINNFRQSASQFMNNSQQTQDFVNTVEKVINDKNYNITFDNTIGDDVNGRIRMNNGEVEIKINPNSERAGEFILTHEITHGIETKEMSNLIMDYASKNSEFNNALQSLKESYGTEDITPEVVADISGQMFGDEAFITNLSTTKPNVFKTIYDKIISLANKITGNSNEALFVKDLKNKWEKAYREANIETARENLGNETRLSKELDNSSFSMKENNDMRDRAKNELGTTTNLNEAGYLTDDGEYLDFSGKRQGARGGQRQMDHREISDIYSDNEYDAAEKKYSNMGSATAILQDFISRGNIRLNGTGVEIATAPTQQQYDKLYDYLEHVQRDNGEVFIDLDTESNNRENLEYTDKTSINKMIKDIKNHYADSNNVENTNVPTKDNQGRTLSQNQQEFFKDVSPEVKDENGNLKTFYRGDPQEINVFDKNHKAKRYTNFGAEYESDIKGFFFTENPDFASEHGDVREYYLKATKPLNIEANKNDLNEIFKPMLDDMLENQDIYQWQYDKAVEDGTVYRRFIDEDGVDWETIDDDAFNKSIDIMRKLGYDSMEVNEGDGEKSFFVFDSNQIKNIDNLNPTDNDDTRYSKENKQWREYLEKNFKNEGKKTYFKDTRMPLADVGTTKRTRNSSFNNEQNNKLESRVSGDALLDAQDLINTIKDVGANVDDNGYVTLYHQTTPENAQRIIDSGKMSSKENAVFFSTSENASQADGRGTTKLEFKVPAENLELDDLFSDNADVKISLNGSKELDVSDYLVKNNIAEAKKDSVITVRNNKGQEMKLTQDKNNPNVYEKEVKIPKDNKSIVPKETMQKQLAKLKDGTKVSNFYSNLTENSKFITQENANNLSQEEIWRYAPQTNKETMANAEARIGDTQKSLETAYGDFLSKGENFSPEDVGVGWILLKRFQDAGNYDAMVQVAKKMRNIATKSGQTVQMFNLQSRLTPEGMVKYAQSELMEAEQQFNKGKSQKEIDKYAKDFELTGEEVEFIKNQMEKIQGMEDGRAKNIEMAKINKMLSDKLPHQRGDSIKAWMRMSMLFNPKTQVRNVVGNALITPINALADVPASIADKAISKKTGTRTIGAPSLSGLATYGKGFAKGGVEAWQDYRMGLDTKDVDMSRFDITQKNPFVTDHKGAARVLNPISKGLNKANSFLDLVMSGGDRVFYQGAFDASLRNQMELNNVKTPTQDMIDIATQEALSRTWNDNNGYTQFVLNTRRALNKASIGGYGLGDVLIPFAKTPANLTKAIYDYSPVGLTTTLFKTKSINNAIETGQITAQMQHDFAQNLGKGVAGTMLYAMAYALAKAGIATGSSDDDKDVANFIKNTMGIQPYSIKIGDKSFTYDWAQPVAAPIAIASDAYQNLTRDSDEDTATRIFNTILDVSNTGFNVLMQQSFLQGISEVLNSNEGVANGIIEQVIGLPARAVPTFVQQINNMFDKTQRVAFEKNQPLKTGKQNVMSKLPGQSQRLAPRVDALGNEVQRYGDSESDLTYALKNFLSPANQSNRKTSKAASEIYDVYEATGDKTIMPMVAPYYIQNKTVGRIDLDSKDRATYQKISGKLINDAVVELTNDVDYNKLSYDEKAEVLNGVVSYANAKAKEHFTGFMANTYNPANKKINNGMSIADYYLEKTMNKR